MYKTEHIWFNKKVMLPNTNQVQLYTIKGSVLKQANKLSVCML